MCDTTHLKRWQWVWTNYAMAGRLWIWLLCIQRTCLLRPVEPPTRSQTKWWRWDSFLELCARQDQPRGCSKLGGPHPNPRQTSRRFDNCLYVWPFIISWQSSSFMNNTIIMMVTVIIIHCRFQYLPKKAPHSFPKLLVLLHSIIISISHISVIYQ